MKKIKSLNDLSGLPDYDPRSLTVEQAKSYITDFISPIEESEIVETMNLLGRVLSRDVISPVNVPPYTNSAMDGYAFKASSIKAGQVSQFHTVGKAFAGKPFTGTVGPKEAVRIMTGAIVPEGTDTVIMQEKVKVENALVSFSDHLPEGTNTRKAGEDIKRGECAVAKGKLIRPGDMGLMASLGIPNVEVYRKLRVACFSTGDELVSIGNDLEIGQIYDSNRYSLNGLLTRLGFEIYDMGVIKDDKLSVEKALIEASKKADVIITTGGVSVGEADYIKEVLNNLGEVLFWKIAMKPGRPLAYGKIKDSHFFGLPGNPVSVMVTFYQFVQDALRKLQGENPIKDRPSQRLRCSSTIRKIPGRTEYQRGIVCFTDGEWTVRTTGDQGSGILSSITRADCFIILQPTDETIEPGEYVEVQMMEGLV